MKNQLIFIIFFVIIVNIFLWNKNLVPSTLNLKTQYQSNNHSSSYILNQNNKISNTENNDFLSNEIKDGFLVWNSKCHIPFENPTNPTIKKFLEKVEYENCSKLPLLSSIVRETTGYFSLLINSTVAKNYGNFTCCWKPIYRPESTKPVDSGIDSKFVEGENCTDFELKVTLPSALEIVMISCKSNENSANTVYKNIHAILNPKKVFSRKNSSGVNNNNSTSTRRKSSILILGIDSISRLNFLRSLPKTEEYLRKNGWLTLKGYNKIGLNTFPNLMAFLTGQNETSAESRCKPTKLYGLDNCPFLWHGFKKAGYITAYGEDYGPWSTFNYLKVGFVQPPTDYYLRPYIVATEKLLEFKYKFVNKYCTGPEVSFNRVFDYCVDFVKNFLDNPYFAFFWINSISHNDLNAISSMDTRILNYFQDLERSGVFNDTLVIFLSDHGMRFGAFRETYMGWYEERLPFLYFHIPHKEYPENQKIIRALKINEHRLSSPYDLYETFRQILLQSNITIDPSSSCPKCQSLFEPLPRERSCADAGISPYWCTCATTQNIMITDKNTLVKKGVEIFLNFANNKIKQYKNGETGKNLCAQLHLKKVHYIHRLLEENENINADDKKYSFRIEVTPGGGLFEYLIHTKGENITLQQQEINRINSYALDGKCLNTEFTKFCSCT